MQNELVNLGGERVLAFFLRTGGRGNAGEKEQQNFVIKPK
jgi:hypothetical protein